MLVGFISLTLVILQEPISRICIKSSLYKKWSPCKYHKAATEPGTEKFQMPRSSDFSFVVEQNARRRLLAVTTTTFTCPAVRRDFLHAIL